MKTVKLFLALAILALVSAAAVPAQEKVPEKLGKLVFLTSCDAKVYRDSSAPWRCCTRSRGRREKRRFARCWRKIRIAQSPRWVLRPY